jgi:hypothetical protein
LPLDSSLVTPSITYTNTNVSITLDPNYIYFIQAETEWNIGRPYGISLAYRSPDNYTYFLYSPSTIETFDSDIRMAVPTSGTCVFSNSSITLYVLEKRKITTTPAIGDNNTIIIRGYRKRK